MRCLCLIGTKGWRGKKVLYSITTPQLIAAFSRIVFFSNYPPFFMEEKPEETIKTARMILKTIFNKMVEVFEGS